MSSLDGWINGPFAMYMRDAARAMNRPGPRLFVTSRSPPRCSCTVFACTKEGSRGEEACVQHGGQVGLVHASHGASTVYGAAGRASSHLRAQQGCVHCQERLVQSLLVCQGDLSVRPIDGGSHVGAGRARRAYPFARCQGESHRRLCKRRRVPWRRRLLA